MRKNTGFYPADILLPKEGLERWSVVACDQFTSDPGYWNQVEELTRGVPSAAHIIFPEARLGKAPPAGIRLCWPFGLCYNIGG